MRAYRGCIKKWQAWMGVLMIFGTTSGAQAALYVYQLPSGTRIITDHPIANKDYKLVKKSESARGVGNMVTERRVQSAIIDTQAYDRLIKRASTVHKVDMALIKAVMHAESAFNPNALSHKGASGLMQLMPETAQRYGVQDIFDPVQNVNGGVRYLRDLMVMFDNNTKLVVAAYNAGENAVKRHKGIPPYAETQDYVRKVLHLQTVYTPKTVVANKASSPATAVTPKSDSTVLASNESRPMPLPAAEVRSPKAPSANNL